MTESTTQSPTSGPTVWTRTAAPRLVPGSGIYLSAVGISLDHDDEGARIYCTTDGISEPSTESVLGQRRGYILQLSGTYALNATVRCKAKKAGYRESEEVWAIYEFQMGRYEYERASYTGAAGRAYLIPYYVGASYADTADQAGAHWNGYSSMLASVDLNTTKYRTVRMRGVDSDFAEFYTYDQRDGLHYQRGTGPYAGQVRVHQVANGQERGFFGGFVHEHRRRNATIYTSHVQFQYLRRQVVSSLLELTAICSDDTITQRDDVLSATLNQSSVYSMSHGFLAPFYNGEQYSGTVVRLSLGGRQESIKTQTAVHNLTSCCQVNATEFCHVNSSYLSTTGLLRVDTEDDPTDLNMTTVDLTEIDDRLRGFVGGFAIGDYAYLVPFFDGRNPGHVVARVSATNFSRETVEILDLSDIDISLSGFFSGFGYTSTSTGEDFGFLVPHRGTYGPVGGVNTRLDVDAWRYATRGNESRIAQGGDRTTEYYHGNLVRLRLKHNLTKEAVDILDLTQVDPDLRGFAGGVVVGRYGLLIPYRNQPGEDGYFGKVVRIDLETFRIDGILDLSRYPYTSAVAEIAGPQLRGFVGGVAWGKYLILVPHRNGLRQSNANMRAHSGAVVRIDVNDFSISGVRVLDLASTWRQQVPSTADNELRGFLFGFAAGDYVYLVPHFARDFHGKLTRIDMRDFDTLADLQEQDIDPSTIESEAIDTFTGVQYVDLERHDTKLVGFAGGFAVRGYEPTLTRTLNSANDSMAWWQTSQDVQLDENFHDTNQIFTEFSRYLVRSSIVTTCGTDYHDSCDDNPKSFFCDCAFLSEYNDISSSSDEYSATASFATNDLVASDFSILEISSSIR